MTATTGNMRLNLSLKHLKTQLPLTQLNKEVNRDLHNITHAIIVVEVLIITLTPNTEYTQHIHI